MNVKNLRRKHTWTEKEAGIILLADLAQLALDSREPGKGKRLLKGNEIAERCRLRITQDRQPLLEAYQLLNENLLKEYNKAVADRQRFFHGVLRIINRVEESAIYEQVLNQAERNPLLVTREQLTRYREEYTSWTADQLQSVPQIILRIIKAFYADPSRAPENVREEMAALERRKLSKKLGDSWARFINAGYWVRKGEEALDPLTEPCELKLNIDSTQLQKAIKILADQIKINIEKKYFEQNYTAVTLTRDKNQKLGPAYEKIWDALASTNISLHVENYLNRERERKKAIAEDMEKIIRNDLYKITPENLKEFERLHTKAELTAYKNKLEWVYSAEWPTKWTKGKILEYLPEFYQGHELQATRDYKKIYTYAWDYLAAVLPDSRESENTFTIGFLANLNIADYREQLEPTTERILKFLHQTRPHWPKYQELAIVENPTPRHLDKRGYYLMAAPSATLPKGLELAEVAKDTDGARTIIEQAYQYLIYPIIKSAYAYNALIDLIKGPFELESAELLKANNAEIEEMAEMLNQKIYRLYANVAGSQEEREEKRAIIKKIFKPIDVEEFKPDQEKIKKAREALEGATTDNPERLYRIADEVSLIRSFLGGFDNGKRK